MNIKEAIENIKNCVRYSMSEYNWREEQDEYDEESLTIAVAAMEKQDPMKPTYDHRYAEMGCSMCGNMVGGWEERPNYCPQCGQKIDWED